MIYIEKNEEPVWLAEYKRHNPTAIYDAEYFVSPLNPVCEDIFTYYPDGVMEGDPYTIDLLNLNAYELKEARKAVYRTIKDLDKETIELVYCREEGALPAYYNVISWFLKNDAV